MVLTPFSMFTGQAEEAMRFYVSTFPDVEFHCAFDVNKSLPPRHRVPTCLHFSLEGSRQLIPF
jgi:predicted 3-demethylubiquinone-9 3-methyltransferase (glyoxalase superfamily)